MKSVYSARFLLGYIPSNSFLNVFSMEMDVLKLMGISDVNRNDMDFFNPKNSLIYSTSNECITSKFVDLLIDLVSDILDDIHEELLQFEHGYLLLSPAHVHIQLYLRVVLLRLIIELLEHLSQPILSPQQMVDITEDDPLIDS